MFSPPLYFMGEAGQSLIDEGEAAVRKRMAELEGQFRAAMHGRAKEVEWRSALELPARYVARAIPRGGSRHCRRRRQRDSRPVCRSLVRATS